MNKDLPYVSVGRGLGEFSPGGISKTFAVANGYEEYNLSQFEYTVWGVLYRFSTFAAWEAQIRKQVKSVPNFDLDKIIRRLIDRHLIMPWSVTDMLPSSLFNLHATRFGYPHGFINQKWLVSDSNNNKSYELSKDQYDVWNAAAGKVMLIEIIDTLVDQRGIGREDAHKLLWKHGLELLKLSLWGLEYVNKYPVEVQS